MFNLLFSRVFLNLNQNSRLVLLRTIGKSKFETKFRDFSRTLVVASFYYKNDYHSKNLNKSIYALPFFFLSSLLAKEKDDPDIKFSFDQNQNSYDKKNISNRERFNFIAETVEKVLPSIVQIEIRQNTYYGVGVSSGSGFIVSSDGIILTNAHVVSSQNSDIIVKLNDGKSFRGRVLKFDQSSDIAIIKIDSNNLKAVKFGDSDKLRTGEFVIALGSPLTLNNTVTSGVVSNPKRDGTELGFNNELLYIQTDTFITQGNSGGPLVNLDGEVIGINSMTATPGISFAIPSKYAIEFLKPEKSTIGSKNHYVGMKMVSLSPQIHSIFNMQYQSDINIPSHIIHGCLIVEVAPNSPAQRAGLKRGDIILRANETVVYKNMDLLRIIKQNKNLDFTVYRDGVELTFKVEADERT